MKEKIIEMLNGEIRDLENDFKDIKRMSKGNIHPSLRDNYEGRCIVMEVEIMNLKQIVENIKNL